MLHPKVDADLSKLPKKVVDTFHDRVDSLARGERHSSTHPLNGPLRGWNGTTIGSAQHRMVHRHEDGNLMILSAGNHDQAYDQALRRNASDDYHMSHRPGAPDDDEEGTAAPAHALDRVFPKDVYTHPHFYAAGDVSVPGGGKALRETAQTLRGIKGKPDAPVTMYRSLPPEHAHKGFGTGDWVSAHPTYAQNHGLHHEDEKHDWPVIKATVPAKHLWNNGDSLDEFGYHGPPIKGELHSPGGSESAKIVQQHKIAFTPKLRVFTHTCGLDHRLWTADEKLKPDVRKYVLSSMALMWSQSFPTWSAWSRVYFAGSEASEWTSEALEGNGDFDVLVGVDYNHLRDSLPRYREWTNGEITDEMNHGFRQYNGETFIVIEGMKTGPWDRTTYVNMDSYDITKIKPYAAYDVGADEWVVKPFHDPHWELDKLPKPAQTVLRACDKLANSVLKLSEPERTQQGAALFDAWHSDRSRAFGPMGQGWYDIANLREKWLDQEGIWAELVNCKHRFDEGLGAALDWSNIPKKAAFDHTFDEHGRSFGPDGNINALRQPITNHRNMQIGHIVGFPDGTAHAHDEQGNKLSEHSELRGASQAVRDNYKSKSPSWAGTHPDTHKPFEVPRPKDAKYLRFGDIPEGERSKNHLDNFRETGVSVYDLHHGHPIETGNGDSMHQFIDEFHKGTMPAYVVSGHQHGEGSDTEPVLRNVKIHGEWNPSPTEHGTHFKEDEDVADHPEGLGRIPDHFIKPTEYTHKTASMPATQKCKYCKSQATHRVIHSEGMAYVPTCADHLPEARDDAANCTPDGSYDPSNVDAVRKIAGANGEDYKGLKFSYWKNYGQQSDKPHYLDGNDKHDRRSFFGMMAHHPDHPHSVGSLEFSPIKYGEGDTEVHIHGLSVPEEHQRRGVGRQMMDELQKHFPDDPINHGIKTEQGEAFNRGTNGHESPLSSNPGHSEKYGDAPYAEHWTKGGKPYDPETKTVKTAIKIEDYEHDPERTWFHGSPKKFKEFKKVPSTTADWNTQLGTHFSTEHDIARSFGKHVYPVKLDMHNPKVYQSEREMDHEVMHKEWQMGNTFSTNPHVREQPNGGPRNRNAWAAERKLHEGDFDAAKEHAHDWLSTHHDRKGITDRFRSSLTSQGHDGIVYGNDYEGPGHASSIVFDPSQAKHQIDP
jgi:GNAT superfamily N-acetyltransferase